MRSRSSGEPLLRRIDGAESAATRPETFRGALIRFDPGEDVAEWLFEFVSALRHQRGVVHRVLALFGDPSNAVWYQHRFTEDEVALGQRTLRALLVGIVHLRCHGSRV